MAEITASDNNQSKKTRSHKSSTKIDMTPMVDLGFLLITFFMLTTTLAKPVIMQLNMPEKEGILSSVVKCSESLTVVLDSQKIYYYQGTDCDPTVRKTDFSPHGIRDVLFNYKRKIGDNFTVVIKSTDQAKYHNMIDLLDELKITNNRRYAIVNMTSDDKHLLSMQ
jgi:biopolymer transport protein ExbD